MSCNVILTHEGENWVWRCDGCNKTGGPDALINAYWSGLVHEEEHGHD